MSQKPKYELLAPAGDVEIGRAAIDAGADAVYIGAERFGAREAAGNSMNEIASLIDYAHLFGARVYITLNTILLEDELKAAEKVARAACEAGADALIVQDMAFTQMNLPIALHASTQTFNLSPERVRLLADTGFTRVVLERGATREQIRNIHRKVPQIELEAFVHGAICVCYSGQCYLGHALCGRGGNRGNCAQPCRSKYDLTDGTGTVLVRNKTLLSVSDLNLSDQLPELAGAGVTSFKIEGRLKDRDYVTNNTAYYHQRMEALNLPRVSAGQVACDFIPDPVKSFSRGFTSYFLNGPRKGVSALESRSVGEFIGTAGKILSERSFRISLQDGASLHNGDGICLLTTEGELRGSFVNRIENGTVTTAKPLSVTSGAKLYRNYDPTFKPSTRRTIGVEITVDIVSGQVRAVDETGIRETVFCDFTTCEPAMDSERTEQSIRQGLSKSGGTIFRVTDVRIFSAGDFLPFLPASVWNRLRRESLEKLATARSRAHRQEEPGVYQACGVDSGALDFRANISNPLAEQFYREAGFNILELAAESVGSDMTGKEVMRTRFCIRREMNLCRKEKNIPAEPLYLWNNGECLELNFDCPNCEMAVIYRGRRRH